MDKYLLSSLLLILIQILSVGLPAQPSDLCIYNGRSQNNIPQYLQPYFDQTSSIYFKQDSLILNNISHPILSLSKDYFDNKAQLREALDCPKLDFKDFDGDINGEINHMRVNITLDNYLVKSIKYVTFFEYQIQYHFIIINDEHYIRYIDLIHYNGEPTSFYQTYDKEFVAIDYVRFQDISGDLTNIIPAKYENVTELVLVQSAYDSIFEIPAEFIIDTLVFDNENSNCLEAEHEIITNTFLANGVPNINITQATLEEVTEQVLVTAAYQGYDYYKRELISIDTTSTLISREILLQSSGLPCNSINIFDCIDHSISLDTVSSKITLDSIYETCRTGYQPAGVYCAKLEHNVPATYTTRKYIRLISPAKSTLNSDSIYYKTISLNRISNKDDLPAACIELTYDTFYVKSLVTPPSVKVIQIPVEHEVREWERLISSATFDYEFGIENPVQAIIKKENDFRIYKSNLIGVNVPKQCVYQIIYDKLIAEGMLTETDILYSNVYYMAILEYQLKNKLKIGAIDKEFLEHLNITF